MYSIQSTDVEIINFGFHFRSDHCFHRPGSGDVFGLGSGEEGRGGSAWERTDTQPSAYAVSTKSWETQSAN